MKNVISFSLYGSADRYIEGAIKNLEELNRVYPSWEMWFYCSDAVLPKVNRIEEMGGVIKQIGDVDRFSCMCMLYRCYPIFHEDVDVCIFRETDSIINLKEKSAVEEWMKGDNIAHSMHDHRSHDAKLMGGMWGIQSSKIDKDAYKRIFVDIIDSIISKGEPKPKGYDQDFLSKSVYPLVNNSIMTHGFFGKGKHRREFKPFPYQGGIKYGTFIGEPVV